LAKSTKATSKNQSGANIGYEAELWLMADALRGSMDASEYKHVVLGLIFLKYISDAFEELHARLDADRAEGADPEDADEYRAQNVFWVPSEARWDTLKAQARQTTVGQTVDDAMEAIERENPQLKGVLPKDYARPILDKTRLGQLIDLISNIRVGDEESRAKDTLGRVYEYFLSQFASSEGKRGGEFYTPRSIVKLLVEMIEPYHGRIYDPCCGSSGMFVQSEEFIEAHGGRIGDISVYGQELNYTTWRLAQMNLAIRGIDGQIAQGDTFHNDRHPDLKADFVLANPPFNISDWGGERLIDDARWKHGVPPKGNANYAWLQHIVHHLSPTGTAGIVLANGSMSSSTSGEGEIRKNMVEGNIVDCMVALPGQLFYSVQIPACLWFLARNRKNGKFRDRRGEVLFIDARKLGTLVDRTHKELSSEDLKRITDAYHSWRGEEGAGEYEDIAGFCKSATQEEVEKHGFVLTPGRYVGAEDVEDDGEPFDEKMLRLTELWRKQVSEAAKLDEAIAANLEVLGYEHLVVSIPPLSEQRAIAHILGTLDDKIELNHQVNETLEAMARAMFKSWFVDFDPVRAKMDGRWQKGQSLPGLPAHMFDMFPDRLVPSELGDIPEGWSPATVDTISDLNPESWSRKNRPDVIKYVDLANTKWGQIESISNFCHGDAPSRAQRILRIGDTIVGTVRPGNGSYALITSDGYTGSTGFAVLRPKRKVYTEYLYLVSTSSENIESLSHLADGGAYPAVRPGVVAETSATLPSDSVMAGFSSSTECMMAKVALNEQETTTLAQLRDTLLPKLISGELRIKDAEAIVGRAT
jgi:type I restriction enzyme M protein